ncbi:MAG: hypothetical protein WHT45_04215 [Ignavibacterium sp.]
MKNIYRIISGTLMIVLLVAGCSKDENNPTDAGSGGNAISITVSAGTTPQYSWSGGNVYSISIVRTSNPGTIVWGLASPGQNAITSPVTHGTGASLVPLITETATTERTLTSGVQYRVTISRLDGTTGWKEFTP